MKKFTEVTVLSLVSKTCDCCGRTAETNDPEFQEFLSIDRNAGFVSVFGDGQRLMLDLCQYCVKRLLGEWLVIADKT